MELKNYMEIAVVDALRHVLATMPQICQCERCKLDIMCMALNRLPPQYTITHNGAVFTKLKMWDVSNQAIILTEITKAAMQVGGKPSHPVQSGS
ncbi:MAG: late competence development ComFB family protein [Carboxydocellales bacterium]